MVKEYDITGGSYMQIPVNNSVAVKRVLHWPHAPNSSQIHHREPHAPFATNYSSPPKQPRVSSAVVARRNIVGPLNPHRPSSASFSPLKPVESNVSRNAPYQARLLDSAFYTTPNGVTNSVPLPSYDSLNDPHLQEYFQRKFASINAANPHPPKGDGRHSSSRWGTHVSSRSMRKSDQEGAIYKVSITTGDKKNAGTDARVYIRINGTKGKLPKRQLLKQKAQKQKTKTKKKPRFKFNKGSTHVFKFEGKDIGDVISITLEHDGLTKEEGWFVEQVQIIKHVIRMGKEKCWVFSCQKWFSLHMDDGHISRDLYPRVASKTEYEVVVVTGDMRNGGTNANVYITLFGKSGQTPKLHLKANSKNNFSRSMTDIFSINTNCVGPMTKCRIQHDNTGIGAGWYLERISKIDYRLKALVESCIKSESLKIVVTDLKNPRWKFYFPCGQWLAKDEGDGLICRDLMGSKDPLALRKSSKYKITVFTGDKRGAGTDANVYCTLFGDLGDSGERKLDTNKNNFERNQVDEFFVECCAMGTLKRLRIGHDNSGLGPGWYLDKVIVDDMENNRVYEFPCYRWFDKSEDDGQLFRDLVCGLGPGAVPEGIPYEITVETGDRDNAATSANVFIVMYGGEDGNQCSGKIWLQNGKFKRGRKDVFNIEVANMLSPLSRIDIGHDNTGAGAGWFLDRVGVKCPSAGIEQWFICDKWLALDEGDGALERTLYEVESMRKKSDKKVTWHIAVVTSDTNLAGTDANVLITIYGKNKQGEYKKSDDIKLENKGDNFEQGHRDEFKRETVDIGRPYKIRVAHDSSGLCPGWHLDKVELTNMVTKKMYLFQCNRWLADDEDDKATEREIPAEGADIKKPQPVVKYDLSVYTGSRRGAGTDANVFINVFGEQGDTGDRGLKHSKTNINKFESGQVDEFTIEAVTLKKLKKIRIGHDGKNPGAGWFLDKVLIRQQDDPSEDCTFEINRWFDIKEDDGLIVREITLGGSQMLSTTSYHVNVKTGDVRGAGTDADVYLKIFGKKGDTGLMPLAHSDNTSNKFERGRTDLFKMEATDIGKIERIRIGHNGANPGAGWFLDEVCIDVPSQGKRYMFACHRWLDKKEDDGQLEIEMTPTHVQEMTTKIPYEVTVWTGELSGAGTDANVFIQMYGENGKSEEYQLRNRTDNFEQGQMDKFKLEAEDVGPLLKVRIGHDGAGMFSGWYLDRMLIQRHPAKLSKRRKRPARPSSTGRRGSVSPNRRQSLTPYGRKTRTTLDSEEDSDDDKLYRRGKDRPSSRYGRRSITPDGDERLSARGRGRRGTSAYGSDEDLRGDKRKKKYRDDDDLYSVRGGSRGRHGTSIYDSDGDSRTDKKNRKKYRGGESDSEEDRKYGRKFGRKGADGREQEDDTEDYWFVCRRWFAKGEDDNKIVRELLPTDEHGNPLETGLQEVEYTVTLYTGNIRGAGTDANVFINITGEYGDTGERQLQDSSTNINKFERDQEDIFKLKAVELGKLKKVKIRHDNKGGGAAWFLGHLEVEDPRKKQKYFFPCQRWLATGEDDGQIARELVPVDRSIKKLDRRDSFAVRNEVALETKAATTTYHVHVFTADKFGAGTDANVYIILFGDQDDTGMLQLKSSLTYSDKFERDHRDEFVIEAVDIGELKKIKIGHDNSGLLNQDWCLDRVEIDCPSLGKKWYFPCGRWLAKGKDDGKLERELYPQDLATEDYDKCVPYEVTTYTSDMRGSSTDADVYIVLYGREGVSSKKSLCSSKAERKSCFKKGAEDRFVVELEDIGEVIEKIRIGHDGAGFGSGWHLDRVEIRRLKETGKGSETHVFSCKRWLARDEEDGAIERELVPERVFEEIVKKDGSVRKKEKRRETSLESVRTGLSGNLSIYGAQAKHYIVTVYTGDVSGAGTDANVFLIIVGDRGDSGERKLHKSELNRDKFERNQTDRFIIEAVDLGKLYKIKIRHDNSMWNPAWFLDRVEIQDKSENETYVFHCERWLAKNKDDCKIERHLYVKGYEGVINSTSTLRSHAVGGSVASLDSVGSRDPFGKSPRVARRQREEIPDGPTIPYTIKVTTGDEKDNGTESPAWIKVLGPRKLHTGRQYLEFAQKKAFEPKSIETFSLEAVDVKDVKQIEIGHDGVTPGSGWFVKEVEVDMPTKGKHYFFSCKSWLARDKGDGKTSRSFSIRDGDTTTMLSYKPLIPYEVTFHTGDVPEAGTDCKLFLKVFGAGGSTSDIPLDKMSERFERGRADLIKMEIEDIAPLKKIRLISDGKGSRPDWNVDKVELRNMASGDLTIFRLEGWISKKKGPNPSLTRDIAAMVRGKVQIKSTTYRVSVKTSDIRRAGTNANVFLVLFGESGDSGELALKEAEGGGNTFERNREDVFIFKDILSMGQLIKARVWHDNKGLMSSWHLSQIEVQDQKTNQKYLFPCNRWLSRSEDDKQIVRELTCANLASPSLKDKISYDIEVITTDKKDAGMMHNAWIILEGDERASKEFVMENSARNKVLRKGQTDHFTMVSRNLGRLKKCILGAFEREDKQLGSAEGREASWHCHQVAITNKATGDKYMFPCKDWVHIMPTISKRHAKVLKCKDVEESMLTSLKTLGTVKYEVSVYTGDVKGGGTDANVWINIHGSHGDTGKRELTQKLRDLFERNQKDVFVLEAIDLGDLTKIEIEHDNKGLTNADWYLEKVDITNLGTNRNWSFPCAQWLAKKKGDGQLRRELYARD